MKVLLGILILLLLVLQYRLFFGEGSLQDYTRLRGELSGLRGELVDAQNRNRALKAEVEDLKSGLDAIEERARAELGMVGEDETFYQFVREQGRQSAAPTSSANTRLVDQDVIDSQNSNE